MPVDLGAEGVAYNLSFRAGSRLHLTGPVIARIFLGQITSWNDPAITALNPGINLPDARSPSCTAPTAAAPPTSSATTSPACPRLGSQDRHWQDAQMAGRRRRRRQWRCRRHGLPHPVLHRVRRAGIFEGPAPAFAAIRNKAGHYVIPSAQSVAADADQKPSITPTDFSIVNQPGASSYPITGYSWALVYAHQPSRATGHQLVSLLDWLTHSGQAYAAATSYVPLPAGIRQLARSMLRQVTGPDGTRLLG